MASGFCVRDGSDTPQPEERGARSKADSPARSLPRRARETPKKFENYYVSWDLS
ncbi:MAG: hypothetical protein RLZZ312_1219 [Bacteroidota bacterium]|jgi:hypothetical protein